MNEQGTHNAPLFVHEKLEHVRIARDELFASEGAQGKGDLLLKRHGLILGNSA